MHFYFLARRLQHKMAGFSVLDQAIDNETVFKNKNIVRENLSNK